MASLNDNFDLETFLKEEVSEAIKNLAPVGEKQPPAPAPKELKVQIGGQEHSFKDEAELSAAMEALMQRAQQEIAAAKAAAQPAPAPKPETSPTGADAPDWSMDKFIELMTKDPREAFDYVDNHRELPKQLKKAAQETEQLKRVLAAEQFRQLHPEFPIQNAAAANLVNQTREQLGLPYDTQGLEAAYFVALNKFPDFRNAVQQHSAALVQQNQAQMQQNRETPSYEGNRPPLPWEKQGVPVHTAWNGGFNPTNPYLQAPPASGRQTQNFTPTSEIDYESLTADQIEAILAKIPPNR